MQSSTWMYETIENIDIPSECILSVDIMPVSGSNLQIHLDLFNNNKGFGGGWTLNSSEHSIFASFNDTYTSDGKNNTTYVSVPQSWNVWHTLKIKYKNNQLIVYLDNYQTASYACVMTDGNKIGIGGHVSTTFYFKNLKVTTA